MRKLTRTARKYYDQLINIMQPKNTKRGYSPEVRVLEVESIAGDGAGALYPALQGQVVALLGVGHHQHLPGQKLALLRKYRLGQETANLAEYNYIIIIIRLLKALKNITWYQCVRGWVGAVLSHTVLLVPMKATSNQKAIPCTVPVCEIFGRLLLYTITSTVE